MLRAISTVQPFSCLRHLGSWLQCFRLPSQVVASMLAHLWWNTGAGKDDRRACSGCGGWPGTVRGLKTSVLSGNLVQIRDTYPSSAHLAAGCWTLARWLRGMVPSELCSARSCTGWPSSVRDFRMSPSHSPERHSFLWKKKPLFSPSVFLQFDPDYQKILLGQV